MPATSRGDGVRPLLQADVGGIEPVDDRFQPKELGIGDERQRHVVLSGRRLDLGIALHDLDHEACQRDGVNGLSSSSPGWMMPTCDSGTSFQAPGRSPSGSETTTLVSSESAPSSSSSGWSALNVSMLVL